MSEKLGPRERKTISADEVDGTLLDGMFGNELGKFWIKAVIDENTPTLCKMLDGKRFVDKAKAMNVLVKHYYDGQHRLRCMGIVCDDIPCRCVLVEDG